MYQNYQNRCSVVSELQTLQNYIAFNFLDFENKHQEITSI